MQLSLCVLTFQRDLLLLKCLESVDNLVIPAEMSCIELIVVDNHGESLANSINFYHFKNKQISLRYVRETQKGIAFARNTAIRNASLDSEYLAFIDDDEIVGGNWLVEMLRVAVQTKADVVTGDVKSILPEGTAQRILDMNFFERMKHRDMECIDYARTGNVLIRRSIFAEVGYFDVAYALSGGEDTHFFCKLHKKGYKIYWCEKAIVEELVGIDRATPSWLLCRWFRVANTEALVTIDLASDSFIQKVSFFIKGIARAGYGCLTLPLAIFFGFNAVMRALQYFAKGMGHLLGAFAIRYLEYK